MIQPGQPEQPHGLRSAAGRVQAGPVPGGAPGRADQRPELGGVDEADLVQVDDLRPVYHRKEQRIRAHVILCWLALLLVRVAETTAGVTWAKIADELDLLTLGTFTGPAGTFRQTAELTKTQRDLLAKLNIAHPKKIIEATPATP
jgi:hypothetical protein